MVIRTGFENFTFLLLSALDAKKYGWCHFFYESYFYQILCVFHLFLDPALTAQSVHVWSAYLNISLGGLIFAQSHVLLPMRNPTEP